MTTPVVAAASCQVFGPLTPSLAYLRQAHVVPQQQAGALIHQEQTGALLHQELAGALLHQEEAGLLAQ